MQEKERSPYHHQEYAHKQDKVEYIAACTTPLVPFFDASHI